VATEQTIHLDPEYYKTLKVDTGSRLKIGHCFQVGNMRIDLTECETTFVNKKPYTDFEIEVEFVDQQVLRSARAGEDLRPMVREMLLNSFILSNICK
jgi:hypothetical protein